MRVRARVGVRARARVAMTPLAVENPPLVALALPVRMGGAAALVPGAGHDGGSFQY